MHEKRASHSIVTLAALGFLAVAGAGMPEPADAAIVLCQGGSGDKLRVTTRVDSCRPRETVVSSAELGATGPAGPAGATGPAGPAGPTGPSGGGGGGGGSLVWKDSNGLLIGPALVDFGNSTSAVIDDNGTILNAQLGTAGFVEYAYSPSALTPFYQTTDCSGQGLANYDTALMKYAYRITGDSSATVYYSPSPGADVNIQSFLQDNPAFVDQTVCDNNFGPGSAVFVAPNGCCLTYTATGGFVPIQSFDVSGWVPPFHLALQ